MKVYLWLFFYHWSLQYSICNADSDNNIGPYKLYGIRPNTMDQLRFLKNLRKSDSSLKVDFWKESFQLNTTSEIMVGPNDLKQFENMLVEHGIKYIIQIEDVQKLINEQESNEKWTDKILSDDSGRTTFKEFNFKNYEDYSNMKSFMHSLEKYYSSIAKVVTLGYTREKRPIEMIKISYPINSESKKAIWIDAGIHAREWIAPSTAMYFINELVTKYDKDPSIKQYVSNLTWYIAPVLNPDGYDYTRSSKSLKMRLWRKNRSRNEDTCTTPGSCCMGIDLNRNFDLHFGEPGASDDPCKEDYRGRSAFSEPEARAVKDFIIPRSKEIQAFITLHSYGQKWMHPYGYDKNVYPPDVSELKSVAVKATNALKDVYGTKYTVGSSADTMYLTSGASDDWAKLKAGIKFVYLIELRRGGFIVNPKEIIPTGRETWEGVKIVANAVLQKNGFTVVKVENKEEEKGRGRGRGRIRNTN